jgi:serine/threonine protein kinase
MQIDERLHPLLDRWVIEAEAGRLLTAGELCLDAPELLPELEREVAVLRAFHALAQPSAASRVQGETSQDSTSDQSVRDGTPASFFDPGTTFGRYRITGELGQGGMGIVYNAFDTQLKRDVALKVMRQDVAANSSHPDRFVREARALAAVRHDHVVEIYDYGEKDGVRFVTMPLLAGETLKTRLEQGALPAAEVVRIGAELADGLSAVHDKGLIHRDLKPANVWLERPNGRVKLLDFGLARDPGVEDRVTRPGALVGTLAYMSPEQANGLDLDARSDLFSLGSVLYEAATGQAPFTGKTRTAILKAVGETDPPPARTVNPNIPQGLSDLIEWLHRKNPADRPASATEVAKAFRALATAPETPTMDSHGGLTRRDSEKRSRKRVPAGAAFAFAVFLIVGAILAFFKDRFRDNRPDNGSPSPGTERKEPLQVRALDVNHFVPVDGRFQQPRGVFGIESFGATLDDDITLTARLSRPAFCYLIVFRPDGKDEAVYPNGADDVPTRTAELHYPRRGLAYRLEEGAGLWLVALVASDKPLPAYSEWRKQHPGGPWKKVDGKPNVVWFDDGDWLEQATPRGVRTRGERGEKKIADAAPIVDVVDWLKAETGGVVSAVAFTVEPRGQ